MSNPVVSSAGLDRPKALKLMADRGLAGMLFTSPENVFYTTGAHTLPGTGNPILFALRGSLPTLSFIDGSGRLTLLIWMGSTMGIDYGDADVRTFIDRPGAEEELASLLGERLQAGSKLGIESTCPRWVLARAEEAAGKDGVVVADDVPFELRLTKSPREIELIERSTKIVEDATADLRGVLRVGLSRLQLGHLARTRLIERGATAIDHLTIAFGSSNPEVLLDETLEPGRLVTLDLGAVFDGYVSDNRRIFLVEGSLSEGTRKLHSTLLGIVDALGDALRPGTLFSDLYAMAVGLYETNGLQPMFLHVGHSIGIETEEAWIGPESAVRVMEGMVLNIELYAPDESGVMVGDEETFLVGAGGSRRITVSPREIATLPASNP